MSELKGDGPNPGGNNSPEDLNVPGSGEEDLQSGVLDTFLSGGYYFKYKRDLEARKQAGQHLHLSEIGDDNIEAILAVIRNKEGIGGDLATMNKYEILRGLVSAPIEFHAQLIGALEEELTTNTETHSPGARQEMIKTLGNFSDKTWEGLEDDPKTLDRLHESNHIAAEALIRIFDSGLLDSDDKVLLLESLNRIQDAEGQQHIESIARESIAREKGRLSKPEQYAIYLHCLQNPDYVAEVREKFSDSRISPPTGLYPVFSIKPDYKDVELYLKSDITPTTLEHSYENYMVVAMCLFLQLEEMRSIESQDGVEDEVEEEQKSGEVRNALIDTLVGLGKDGSEFVREMYSSRVSLNLGRLARFSKEVNYSAQIKKFQKELVEKLPIELRDSEEWQWTQYID